MTSFQNTVFIMIIYSPHRPHSEYLQLGKTRYQMLWDFSKTPHITQAQHF
ncbi:hypothetical protein F383_34191 [Gossypium arboreum]|uniref:Uncharacterized protein n=1 Tax=Gossypium arboreum TaxID=29729 RepID=A0A0B0PM00_GOSAR|nr:hypothetical protein F383_34191 [Gossypium arboreum]